MTKGGDTYKASHCRQYKVKFETKKLLMGTFHVKRQFDLLEKI
jgi:hypothetical protein